MLQAGASYIVQSFNIAGLLAAEYIGHPVAFEAIHGVPFIKNKTRIWIKVKMLVM
jgi:voltage-gated potassium channel